MWTGLLNKYVNLISSTEYTSVSSIPTWSVYSLSVGSGLVLKGAARRQAGRGSRSVPAERWLWPVLNSDVLSSFCVCVCERASYRISATFLMEPSSGSGQQSVITTANATTEETVTHVLTYGIALFVNIALTLLSDNITARPLLQTTIYISSVFTYQCIILICISPISTFSVI